MTSTYITFMSNYDTHTFPNNKPFSFTNHLKTSIPLANGPYEVALAEIGWNSNWIYKSKKISFKCFDFLYEWAPKTPESEPEYGKWTDCFLEGHVINTSIDLVNALNGCIYGALSDRKFKEKKVDFFSVGENDKIWLNWSPQYYCTVILCSQVMKYLGLSRVKEHDLLIIGCHKPSQSYKFGKIVRQFQDKRELVSKCTGRTHFFFIFISL